MMTHVTHARVTWSSDVVWIWVWVWVRDHVVRPVHAGINPGGFYALCMKQAASPLQNVGRFLGWGEQTIRYFPLAPSLCLPSSTSNIYLPFLPNERCAKLF